MWHQITYRVGAHFLPAIINGDESGLTDVESAQLGEWLAQQQDGRNASGHWATVEDSRDEFALCEVTGLWSECESVTFNWRE